jgi:tRNA pseudouridine55 synthase
MRSLAHEMGQLLGCGAHLECLRRIAVSEFTLADAYSLDRISAAAGKNKTEKNVVASCPEPGSKESTDVQQQFFVHPRKILPHFPSVTADEFSAARIRTGQSVNLPDFSRARQVKVFIGQTQLIAIATRVAGTLFHPKIVLCSS